MVLAFGFLNAIHIGAMFTLGPAVAKDTIGEQGWGLVLSAESVGLLLMTVVLLRVPLQRPLLLRHARHLRCSACRWSCSAPTPASALLVVAIFVAGAGIEVFRIGLEPGHAGEHRRTRCCRGPTPTTRSARSSRCPIGQLAYGPLGEAFGYEEVLVVSGIAYVAICLLTLLSRSVRDLPRRQERAEPSGQPAA